MRPISQALSAVVLSLLALACGPAEGDDDGGGTTSGTSSSDDASDASSSESTGAPSCDPSTPVIGDAVTVTITNDGASPVYLPETSGCVVGAVFSLTASGGGEALEWIVDDCQTCAAAIEGACACPAACPADSSIRIDPGGVYVSQWPGTIAFPAELTPECADPNCGPQCTAIAKADEGSYVARVTASTSIDCNGGPQCDCVSEPAPAGWCRVGATVTGESVGVEQTFQYPATIPVELSIDAG